MASARGLITAFLRQCITDPVQLSILVRIVGMWPLRSRNSVRPNVYRPRRSLRVIHQSMIKHEAEGGAALTVAKAEGRDDGAKDNAARLDCCIRDGGWSGCQLAAVISFIPQCDRAFLCNHTDLLTRCVAALGPQFEFHAEMPRDAGPRLRYECCPHDHAEVVAMADYALIISAQL